MRTERGALRHPAGVRAARSDPVADGAPHAPMSHPSGSLVDMSKVSGGGVTRVELRDPEPERAGSRSSEVTFAGAPAEISRFPEASHTAFLVFVPDAPEPQALVRCKAGWFSWKLMTGERERLPFSWNSARFVRTGRQWQLWGDGDGDTRTAPAVHWPSREPTRHSYPWAHGGSSCQAPLVCVSPDGRQIARVALPPRPSLERIWVSSLEGYDPGSGARYMEVSGGGPGNSIQSMAWSTDSRYVVCGTLGDNIHVADAVANATFNVSGSVQGHPQWVATHPSEAYAAHCSGVVEVFDLEARRVVSTLKPNPRSTPLMGEFSRTGDFICVADGTILRWDWRAHRVLVQDTPDAANPLSGGPVRISPDGSILVYATRDALVAASVDAEHTGIARRTPPARPLLELLEGPHPHVRFGAASAVIEGAGGLAPHSADCPACGGETWLKLAPIHHESRTKTDKGPHMLRKRAKGKAAAEYDETAFSTFHLAELFRGARGATRLDGFLAGLGLIEAEDSVYEHYAWPVIQTDHPHARLGRPSLLVRTSDKLIGFVLLPMRADPKVVPRVPRARIDACRELLHDAASRLGVEPLLRVIAAYDVDPPNPHEVLGWDQALRALASIDPSDARMRNATSRWQAALGKQPFPVLDDKLAQAVIEEGSRIWDYSHPVLAYRHQFTVTAFKVEVCEGCGYTRSAGDVDGMRAGENGSLLDLIAEVAEDHVLAQAWLDALGVGCGDVERVLCWPRLEPLGTSPDAVFVGTGGVTVIEAKRVEKRLVCNEPNSREVLERVANAHFMSLVLGGGRTARVLVCGETADTDATASELARNAWTHFGRKDGHRVLKWSKSKKEEERRVLFDEQHEVSKAIRRGGEGGIREALVVRDFHAMTDALEQVAIELADRVRPSSPLVSRAYEDIAARSADFMSFRGL